MPGRSGHRADDGKNILTNDPNTSFGEVSMQVDTAADLLGCDSGDLSSFQKGKVIEALKDPAAFPGRHDSEGAFGAVVCVTLAAAAAVGAVTTRSRGRLSKVVCVAIVAAGVYRVISVSGQL
ncbi:hypothetical protein [Streptomyces sp. KL116D]|uniref:hypothetical protein n=1 Tax=Streptomyces sp. KL116D TaxID=3045152 RepID=UPI003556A4BF